MTSRKHLSYLCSLKKTKRANKSNMNALQITSGKHTTMRKWKLSRHMSNVLQWIMFFYILEITIIL